MNYYIFNVSDQQNYATKRTAQETFNKLVKDNKIWGFGLNTANRKAIQAGDKVVFYLTGAKNQVFAGSATLASGAYKDDSELTKGLFLHPEETLRIDLTDVIAFPEPKPRKEFKSLEWSPSQGGSIKISERDYQIVMGEVPDVIHGEIEDDGEQDFYLEKYLEDFLVSNWDSIDFGEKLTIYQDEDGNLGQQYFTEEVGYIDILAQDSKKNFVVIELKKGRKNDEVVGQVLRYMGWVRKHIAKNGENVRGLIIVGEKDAKLEYATEMVRDKVDLKLYKIKFQLREYK